MTSDATIVEHLGVALGAVLAARILAGQVDAPSLPDEALHAALGSSGDYQAARDRVRAALDALQADAAEGTWAKSLELEAAMNAAGAEAVEVAWKLGWSARATVRSR